MDKMISGRAQLYKQRPELGSGRIVGLAMLCSSTNDPAGCYTGGSASGYNLVHPTTAMVYNGSGGCGTGTSLSHHHHHHHHDYGYPRAEVAGSGPVNSFVQDLAVAAAAAAALTYQHHHPPNPSITTTTASASVSSSGLIYPPAAVKKFWEHPPAPPPPPHPPGQQKRTADSLGLPLKSSSGSSSTATNSSRNSGTNRPCRSGPSSSTSGSKKRKRVATVAQRRAANIRERRRMFNLNEAFDKLRRKVPTFAYEKRLSRIETLRLAITYISFMDQVIRNEPSTSTKPSTANNTTAIHHQHPDANRQDQLDTNDYRQPAISPAW